MKLVRILVLLSVLITALVLPSSIAFADSGSVPPLNNLPVLSVDDPSATQ